MWPLDLSEHEKTCSFLERNAAKSRNEESRHRRIATLFGSSLVVWSLEDLSKVKCGSSIIWEGFDLTVVRPSHRRSPRVSA
jgi:hypothetical protein